jgi:hypothetical protein
MTYLLAAQQKINDTHSPVFLGLAPSFFAQGNFCLQDYIGPLLPFPCPPFFMSSHNDDTNQQPEPYVDHVYQPVQSQSHDIEDSSTEQDSHQRNMDAQLQRYLTKVQVLTPLAILLNVASLAVCSILTTPTLGWINSHHWTQFTPNPAFVLIYWATLFLLQVGFAVLVVLSQKDFTKVSFMGSCCLLSPRESF